MKSRQERLFMSIWMLSRALLSRHLRLYTDQRLYRFLKIDEVESSKLKVVVAWALKSKHSKDYKASRSKKVLEYVF